MGPESGLALCSSILNHTHASTDQEHLSVILMSFPRHLADRTLFLEGSVDVNPAYNVVEVIRKLENAGAQIVGIACNTCHSPEILDVISSELKKIDSHVKLVEMPFETCRYLRDYYPGIRRVGVMATNGTYKSSLYKDILHDMGYEAVIPDFEFQDEVIHKMIYDRSFGIKSNTGCIKPESQVLLRKALSFFKGQGTEAIIIGCTEISLILTDPAVDGMVILDSTQILAKALIREASE